MAALTYKGKAQRRGDGKSVNVVVPSGQTWQSGELHYASKYHGFAMAAGIEGELVALDTEVGAVWEMTLPAEVTGAKGDTLYLTTADGTISDTAGTGKVAFGKVWSPKDTNNIAYVQHLENN